MSPYKFYKGLKEDVIQIGQDEDAVHPWLEAHADCGPVAVAHQVQVHGVLSNIHRNCCVPLHEAEPPSPRDCNPECAAHARQAESVTHTEGCRP